ncbi:hypothetical protein B0H11DRAFT_1906544 [Mycena galericulata]|nr:hypothetical protein B0H11DRAFT_1906544 [Mycena galericulata]
MFAGSFLRLLSSCTFPEAVRRQSGKQPPFSALNVRIEVVPRVKNWPEDKGGCAVCAMDFAPGALQLFDAGARVKVFFIDYPCALCVARNSMVTPTIEDGVDESVAYLGTNRDAYNARTGKGSNFITSYCARVHAHEGGVAETPDKAVNGLSARTFEYFTVYVLIQIPLHSLSPGTRGKGARGQWPSPGTIYYKAPDDKSFKKKEISGGSSAQSAGEEDTVGKSAKEYTATEQDLTGRSQLALPPSPLAGIDRTTRSRGSEERTDTVPELQPAQVYTTVGFWTAP